MNIEKFLVSGAPDKIYDLPGSVFEYHHVASDYSRSKMAGIEFVLDLYKSAYYRHTAHKDMFIENDHPWSDDLMNIYNSEKHCHSAGSAIIKIKNSYIQNSIIYCNNDDKDFVLYESFRFPDRQLKEIISFEKIKNRSTNIDQTGRSYLYIGSAGSFNYGHWLVDDLPRVKAWSEIKAKLGISCVILLPSHGPVMDNIRLQSMRTLIDKNIKAKFINPDKIVNVSDLYFITPVSFHPRIKNPYAIHYVRSQAQQLDAAKKEPFRKIFVARRPPNSRSIVNFEQLWSFLEKNGFEMIEPEKYSFTEQVTLFQEAKIVIGQMGAAMTGTMFCLPATTIIYLAPIGWAEPFYLDLAALGGQHYNILSGPIEGDGTPHLSDFTIPIEPLYHRLAYTGYANRN